MSEEQNAAPEAVAWRYKFRLRNGELSKWLTTEYPPRAGAEVVEELYLDPADTIAALTDRNRALTKALEIMASRSDEVCGWTDRGFADRDIAQKALHPTQPKEPNDG